MSACITTPSSYPDRSEQWEAEHHRRRCAAVAPLITDKVIEEHRCNPFGYRDHHSLALQRLDRLLKTYPSGGSRLVPILEASGDWRILERRRFSDDRIVDKVEAGSLEEIVHDIFLRRIAALRTMLEAQA